MEKWINKSLNDQAVTKGKLRYCILGNTMLLLYMDYTKWIWMKLNFFIGTFYCFSNIVLKKT